MAETSESGDKEVEVPPSKEMREAERICGILEKVATNFLEGSEEAEAIAEAAGAFLWLSLRENLKVAYDKWRSLPGKQSLSDRQNARMTRGLADMGIDPDGPDKTV